MPAPRRLINPTTRSARIRPRPEKKPDKRPAWRIPLAWLREESFYRDIATRALSIAVVALGAYLYAISVGYIATPTGRQTFTTAISAFVVIFTIVGSRALARQQWRLAFLLIAAFVLVIILQQVLMATWVNDSADEYFSTFYQSIRSAREWSTIGVVVTIFGISAWVVPKVKARLDAAKAGNFTATQKAVPLRYMNLVGLLFADYRGTRSAVARSRTMSDSGAMKAKDRSVWSPPLKVTKEKSKP